MSVSKEVQEFINNSLAQNNRALLDHISKLVAADDQLREIKKLRREEPKVFKRKGNTNSIPSFRIRWMMSNCISRPTHSTRLNRPCQKVHVIAHRKAKAIPFSMHINQISVGRPLRNIPSMNLLMMRRMAKRFDGQRKEPRKPWSPRLPRRLLSVLPRPLVVRLLIPVPCRISGVTRRLASRLTRVTGCPYFVYPAFHQDAVIVLLVASLATGGLSAFKFLVLRFLDPKVFQVTSE